MEKPEFVRIMKEYGLTDSLVEALWATKPTDDLTESFLRVACEKLGWKVGEKPKSKMDESTFKSILKECGYNQDSTDRLWDLMEGELFDEQSLRETCIALRPLYEKIEAAVW